MHAWQALHWSALILQQQSSENDGVAAAQLSECLFILRLLGAPVWCWVAGSAPCLQSVSIRVVTNNVLQSVCLPACTKHHVATAADTVVHRLLLRSRDTYSVLVVLPGYHLLVCNSVMTVTCVFCVCRASATTAPAPTCTSRLLLMHHPARTSWLATAPGVLPALTST